MLTLTKVMKRHAEHRAEQRAREVAMLKTMHQPSIFDGKEVHYVAGRRAITVVSR